MNVQRFDSNTILEQVREIGWTSRPPQRNMPHGGGAITGKLPSK